MKNIFNLVHGILGGFVSISFIVVSSIRSIAIYSFFRDAWGWWILPAIFASGFVGYMPVLGGICGYLAMRNIWEYSIFTSVLIAGFPLWSTLIIFVLVLFYSLTLELIKIFRCSKMNIKEKIKKLLRYIIIIPVIPVLFIILMYLAHEGRWSFKVKDFNSYCKSLLGLNEGYFIYESPNLEKQRLIVKNEWLKIIQDGNLDFLRHTLLKDYSELKFKEAAKTLTTADEYGDSAIDVKEEVIDGKLFIIFRFYGMGDMPKDNFNNAVNKYKEYIHKAEKTDIKYFNDPYMFCAYRGLYNFYEGLLIDTTDFFGRGFMEKIYFNNKKQIQEPLSIETKVKIAQEKCLHQYKIEELKMKDNIGMLTDDEIKIEYRVLEDNLLQCVKNINQKFANKSNRSKGSARLLKNLGLLDKDDKMIVKDNK